MDHFEVLHSHQPHPYVCKNFDISNIYLAGKQETNHKVYIAGNFDITVSKQYALSHNHKSLQVLNPLSSMKVNVQKPHLVEKPENLKGNIHLSMI